MEKESVWIVVVWHRAQDIVAATVLAYVHFVVPTKFRLALVLTYSGEDLCRLSLNQLRVRVDFH